MYETQSFMAVIYSITSIIWIILHFVATGISFFRFKTTATGWLLGISLLLLGLKQILFIIVTQVILPAVHADYTSFNIMYIFSMIISIILFFFVGAGIALIPRSLRLLAEKA